MRSPPLEFTTRRCDGDDALLLSWTWQAPVADQTPSQVVRDLQRALHALRDDLGQGNEGVDLPGILVIDDVDARLAQTVRVEPSLVAQRIEAGGDDERGWLPREVAGAHRRRARIRPIRLAAQILLGVPQDAIAWDDVAVHEVAMRGRVVGEIDGGIDQYLAGGHGQLGAGSKLGHDGREVAARRVSRHGHAARIRTDLAPACSEKAIG